MDVDANSQTPCRIRTSSSVLFALSSLTPPSPILSPSQLCATWTSGEIPILFDSPSITSLSSSDSGGMCGITPCLSAQTVETMCTFGPTSKESNQVGSECQHSSQNIANDGCSLANPDYHVSIRSKSVSSTASPILGFLPLEECYPQNFGACTRSHSVTSACIAHPSGNSRLPVISGLRGGCDWPVLPEQDSSAFKFSLSSPNNVVQTTSRTSFRQEGNDCACEQNLRYIPPSQTFSTLPTPSFAPPSPSPSVDMALSYPSSPRSRRKFHFNTEYLDPRQDNTGSRHGPWRVPCEGPLRSIRVLQEQSTPVLTNSTPYSPTAAGPCSPAYNHGVEVICSSVQSSLQGPASNLSHSPFDPKYAFLPQNLSWLKDIMVELLIDQEGFRSIQPSFKLIGYTQIRRSTRDPYISSHSNGSIVDDGMVEFMPVKRQSYIFHYAPFDSLPTLRRITVNGNESRDYISRQASLSLKSNGVYTVRGTETSSLPSYLSGINPSPGSDHAKLKWKFDYMVDDRRVEATGRIMDGEKTLIPLTFSCSPVLLHSLQGKKIRLMHIVRKSVIPNLTAEKMEPPNLSMRRVPSMSNFRTTIQNTYLAKSHAWNKHRRARSNVVSHGDEEPLMTSGSGLGDPIVQVQASPKLPRGQMNNQQMRRRRASSAGERTRSDPFIPAENMVPSFQPSKHIIAPSHLCELLSADAEGTTRTVYRYKPHLEALIYSPPKSGRAF